MGEQATGQFFLHLKEIDFDEIMKLVNYNCIDFLIYVKAIVTNEYFFAINEVGNRTDNSCTQVIDVCLQAITNCEQAGDRDSAKKC